jgi:hypothetical protein
MPLLPCPNCRRHVSLDETECPFCAVALPVRTVRADPRLGRRLGRVAAFTMQAAVTTSAVAACDGVVQDDGSGGQATGGETASGGQTTGGAATGDGAQGGDNVGGAAGAGGDGNECDWDACAIYSAIPTP